MNEPFFSRKTIITGLVALGIVGIGVYLFVKNEKKKEDEIDGVADEGGEKPAKDETPKAGKKAGAWKPSDARTSTAKPSTQSKPSKLDLPKRDYYQIHTRFYQARYLRDGISIPFQYPIDIQPGEKRALVKRRDGDFTLVHEGVKVTIPKKYVFQYDPNKVVKTSSTSDQVFL